MVVERDVRLDSICLKRQPVTAHHGPPLEKGSRSVHRLIYLASVIPPSAEQGGARCA